MNGVTFFVCATKDDFTEKLFFDRQFWNNNVEKCKIFYKDIVIPKLNNFLMTKAF